LLSGEFGFEIGWLVPAALLATILVLIARRGTPRTDLVRAGAIVFGGWLLVDGLVLSYMHGMVHPYYSLSIAPPVAAMFAIGVQQMWARRETAWRRIALAATLLAAGVWGWSLLANAPTWLSMLRWLILVLTVVGSTALLWRWTPGRRYVATAFLAAALVGALGGPAAYAVATVTVAHQGGGPSVGPPRAGRSGGWSAAVDNPEVDAMLKATGTPWSAAIERSSAAAGFELSTGTAVMAIGGFSGEDPTPTLQQFQDDVARHQVAYYLAPGGSAAVIAEAKEHDVKLPVRGHADILKWVRDHFQSRTVDDMTVYDLSAPK
jgi:4-amino-4-deoxy-L-arabinose transferase-like glycosyltransferase